MSQALLPVLSQRVASHEMLQFPDRSELGAHSQDR
jgi:hypothetical protein